MAIFTEYTLENLKYRVRNILGELEEGADGFFWTNNEIYDYINQSIFFCFGKIRWWANPWQDFYDRLSIYTISNQKEFRHLLKILSKPPILQKPMDLIDIPQIFMMTIVNYAIYLAKNKDTKEDLTLFRQQAEEYIIQCRKFVENYVDTTVVVEGVVAVGARPPAVVLEVPVPTGLKAVLTEDLKVKLTWDLISRERYDYLGYNVYRSETESGAYTKIAELLTVAEFIDTNVSYGRTYYYYVSVVYEIDDERKEKNSSKVSIRIHRDIYEGYFKIDDFEGDSLNLEKWVYGFSIGMPIDNRISVIQKNGRVFFELDDIPQGTMTFALKDGEQLPFKILDANNDFEFIWSVYIDKEVEQPATLYTIIGRVYDQTKPPGEDGIPGVSMQLKRDGDIIQEYMTTEYGDYLFENVEGGKDYIVIPYHESYMFDPEFREYLNLSEDKSEQNFIGTEIPPP